MESIGNRRLFSDDECDSCNKFFGNGIENDFGRWSLPYRVMSCVKGKKGYPALSRDPYWRIQSSASGLEIHMREDWKIAHFESTQKAIRFDVLRESFIPIAVYKTFVRMALALMPSDELQKFQGVKEWIRNCDHTITLNNVCSKILFALIPGNAPPDTVSALLCRRTTDNKNHPYMVFVLLFSNYAFQVFIPSPEVLQNSSFETTCFPLLLGIESERLRLPKTFDLSGSAVVKNENVCLYQGFESVEEEHTTAYANIATCAYFLWEKREGVKMVKRLQTGCKPSGRYNLRVVLDFEILR
jgi:hypothetical protein